MAVFPLALARLRWEAVLSPVGHRAIASLSVSVCEHMFIVHSAADRLIQGFLHPSEQTH